jgi:L,D-transpeptidase YcbB
MHYTKSHCLQLTIIILCLFIISCNNTGGKRYKKVAAIPQKMDEKASQSIGETLAFALMNNGKIDDSIGLYFTAIVDSFYNDVDYELVWSDDEEFKPLADTLFNFIANAEQEGLFANDYHFNFLKSLKNKLDNDALKKMGAPSWIRADIMFTDAFMHIIQDLKHGRLQPDSITLTKDSTLANDFFVKNLQDLLEKKNFTHLLHSLQPAHKGYWALKNGIKAFLDSMDRRTYTYVAYPFKKGNLKDSIFCIKNLQKRLYESGAISYITVLPDSADLSEAIKKYQIQKGLRQDGIISSALVRTMNISDAEKFKRIAITLDRYKQLPAKMPPKYIWVNLPAYYLWVIDHDTVVLESKVICGKPSTRTPLLNSTITDMVTYPTWTVPNSIIAKNYLPKLKNNPGYLAGLGLNLINGRGEIVDPYNINWGKYAKGIPFRVMQGSGDNNALGIFKFNFNNPYSVYLHDTNQRNLFKNSSRALSHGCVRVQEWEKLAFYIARNDSMNIKITDTLQYNTDSIKNWIANKEKHRMDVKSKIPIFIRYFSCEGIDGKIKFYDDIYGEDKALREKYFADGSSLQND